VEQQYMGIKQIESKLPIWLICLDLVMLAANTLAADSISAQNARFTSASTVHFN
jgi:hypothetical protein